MPAEAEGAPSHDKVFKTLFRTFFRDLVELVEPDVAAVLTFDQVEFVAEPAFTDLHRYGAVVADLVAKTTTQEGADQLVLVHVEVESRFQASMEERMWRYFLHLALKYQAPIVSIVVFLAGGEPGVLPRTVVFKVGPWEAARFSYFSFGLAGSLAEEWLEKPQHLAAALAALMRSEIWDRVEQKLHCLRAIVDEDDDRKRFLLNKVIDIYLQFDDEAERARFERALDNEPAEVKDMVLTLDEAIEASELRGEARGEARGIAAGTRHTLELLLTRRFGQLPDHIHLALSAIDDPARLNALFEAALDAASLTKFEQALA